MRQALTRRTENLEYVQAMLPQLRRMAEDERHEILAYLIEMACIEANDIMRGARVSRIRHDEGDRAARVTLDSAG